MRLTRMEELRHAPPEERGKLGVFWHTQGSGKTLSMLFFSQKVLRTMPGQLVVRHRHRPRRP